MNLRKLALRFMYGRERAEEMLALEERQREADGANPPKYVFKSGIPVPPDPPPRRISSEPWYGAHIANFEDFPVKLWYWRHFRRHEIACRDGSIMVVPAALDALDQLREILGYPLIINSAYRSPEYNAALRARGVGAAVHSRHMQGIAFDVNAGTITSLDDFETVARSVGFKRFGWYPPGPGNGENGFVHIDTDLMGNTWGLKWRI